MNLQLHPISSFQGRPRLLAVHFDDGADRVDDLLAELEAEVSKTRGLGHGSYPPVAVAWNVDFYQVQLMHYLVPRHEQWFQVFALSTEIAVHDA